MGTCRSVHVDLCTRAPMVRTDSGELTLPNGVLLKRDHPRRTLRRSQDTPAPGQGSRHAVEQPKQLSHWNDVIRRRCFRL